MRKTVLTALFSLFFASAALATSSIDTAQPVNGAPFVSTPVRGNFSIAAGEITALQAKFPVSSTDEAVARYDGVVGSLQDGKLIERDDGTLSLTTTGSTYPALKIVGSGSQFLGQFRTVGGVGVDITKDGQLSVSQSSTSIQNLYISRTVAGKYAYFSAPASVGSIYDDLSMDMASTTDGFTYRFNRSHIGLYLDYFNITDPARDETVVSVKSTSTQAESPPGSGSSPYTKTGIKVDLSNTGWFGPQNGITSIVNEASGEAVAVRAQGALVQQTKGGGLTGAQSITSTQTVTVTCDGNTTYNSAMNLPGSFVQGVIYVPNHGDPPSPPSTVQIGHVGNLSAWGSGAFVRYGTTSANFSLTFSDMFIAGDADNNVTVTFDGACTSGSYDLTLFYTKLFSPYGG